MSSTDDESEVSGPPGWPASRPWSGSGWLSVTEAQTTPGLRITDSPHWGAWWAQALRGILHIKGLAYAKVVHPPFRDDEPQAQAELRHWTGQTSVPTMVSGDGTPGGDIVRNDWLGQLMLAEELEPSPSLLPTDVQSRVEMIGLCHELMSPQGFMWNGRIAMSDMFRDAQMSDKQRRFFGRGKFLGGKYSFNGKPGTALDNMVECLTVLESRLIASARDSACGRTGDGPLFFGTTLTALDIYWVYASNFISILPEADLPVMRFNRAMYTGINEALDASRWPQLLTHRDHVLRTYLPCPVCVS